MLWLLTSVAMAVCGDGFLDADEACDDFNTATGDGCSAECQVEHYWECEEPVERPRQTVSWNARSNCASSPRTELVGIGAAVSVPDWPAIGVSPTNANCWSPWSSGNESLWRYSTAWQGGPLSTGVGGSFGGYTGTLANCRAHAGASSFIIDPQGQPTLYFGMRDNPCTDNRGSVQLVITPVSECIFVGDLDGDGVFNDDDDCPTVYNHLDAPYDDNLACVSELATWDDAFVGPRALVHREADVRGAFIGARAEIGQGSTIAPGAVVGRRVSVGAGSLIGPDSVLSAWSSVGAGVRNEGGGAIGGLYLGYGARVGDAAVLGDNLTLGGEAEVGARSTVGAGSVVHRGGVVGVDSFLGSTALLAPFSRVGDNAQFGERSVLRRSASVGDGARVGLGVGIGRETSIGDGATVGDGAVLRFDVTVAPGASVPAGSYVPARTAVE